MTAQHRVGPRQLEEMERYLRLLWAAVHQPTLTVPPSQVLAQLNTWAEELRPDGLPAEAGFLGSDPNDFLYLTLPAEELEVLIGTFNFGPSARLTDVNRIRNTLLREHIFTVEDLLSWSRTELIAVRVLGEKLVDIIEAALHQRGWHLSQHDVRDIAPPLGDRWVRMYSGRVVLLSRLGRESVAELRPALTDCKTGRSRFYSLVLNALVDLDVLSIGQLLELSNRQLARLKWAGKIPGFEEIRLPSRSSLSETQVAIQLIREILAIHGLELRLT